MTARWQTGAVRSFEGRVAVVTGAAGGIGRALAERCAREGMRVVLADIEEAALRRTELTMAESGATVLAVRTDVSRREDVEALARRTLDTFGAVHLLFNNAGVGGGSSSWESSVEDWTWVLGVNLWGVIHGIRTFVPIMLRQGEEGHVVNTASLSGLVSLPWGAVYQASKYAVVAISESLYYELALRGASIGVSVLCPGFVRTGFLDSARNRPAELCNDGGCGEPARDGGLQRRFIEAGLAPEAVAERAFAAIRARQLWVLTHPETRFLLRARVRGILGRRHPGIPLRLLRWVGAGAGGGRSVPRWVCAVVAPFFPRVAILLE